MCHTAAERLLACWAAGGRIARNVGGVLAWDAAKLAMRGACIEGGVWTALLVDGAAAADAEVCSNAGSQMGLSQRVVAFSTHFKSGTSLFCLRVFFFIRLSMFHCVLRCCA